MGLPAGSQPEFTPSLYIFSHELFERSFCMDSDFLDYQSYKDIYPDKTMSDWLIYSKNLHIMN